MNDSEKWGIDLPLAEIPKTPEWSENYACDAYDPVQRLFIFLHVGRWPADTALWHEFILVCKDGKATYSRRHIGRLPDPREVGANCLRLECLEPCARWRWRYHGPVLFGANDDLLIRPPDDTEATLLDFDLMWSAVSPLIDFGHGTEPGAVGSHVEQGGTTTGRITIAGVSTDFHGRSFRDHSRGPRNLKAKFFRHSWIHGTFPSGRTISSLTVEKPDRSLGRADLFVIDAAGNTRTFYFAKPLLWDTWEDRHRPFTLAASDAHGNRISIEAEPLFSAPFTLAHPSDLWVGQSNRFEGWRVFEMPTRFLWDGEETFGLTEITLTPETSRAYPLG